MKKTLTLLLLTIVALTSCDKEVSNNVDQSKIWTSYELFYDQNTDITYAQAVFRFSSSFGTKLKLSDPSEVKFGTEIMSWDAEEGHYQKQNAGLLSNGTFEWTDTEGNVYTNSVDIRQIAYPVLDDTIYKDQMNEFSWVGDAVDTLESVHLTIDGSTSSDARGFSIDTIGHTVLKIDSLLLTQVTTGDVTLHLDRNYLPSLQEETERGGRLLGRYRPTDQMVFLADSIM